MSEERPTQIPVDQLTTEQLQTLVMIQGQGIDGLLVVSETLICKLLELKTLSPEQEAVLQAWREHVSTVMDALSHHVITLATRPTGGTIN